VCIRQESGADLLGAGVMRNPAIPGQRKRMNEKKYKKGIMITGIDELGHIIFKEHKYIYLDEKPLHPRFIINFSFKLIVYCLRNGRFFRAELNKKVKL